jgi:hypothetical protein
MTSSGMLGRVALLRTDLSEEHRVSFIRVTTICVLGTTLAVTSNRRTLRSNTKAIRSSETSVLTRVTRRNISEDAILHNHLRENVNLTNQYAFTDAEMKLFNKYLKYVLGYKHEY